MHCVFKKVKLIIHDCLTIVMLLYVMLYIVLAYLMLFAAMTNAVCLNNGFFFLANAFYFHALSLFTSVFLLICIMHSAFNLFVFPNYMFTSLLFF